MNIKGLRKPPNTCIFDKDENLEDLRRELLAATIQRGTGQPINRADAIDAADTKSGQLARFALAIDRANKSGS